MKILKYIISAALLLTFVWSCEDETDNLDFINNVVAPANVSALFDISQDNTGTVSITPNAEGAISYEIYYGDGTTEPAIISQGETQVHVYAEGVYTVSIVAIGVTGLETEYSEQITVSFKAPENLEVIIENDPGISKQVNVTATADYAMTFEVHYGEDPDAEPVVANIGETASFVYQEPGIYTIRVVAKGGAIETTEYTEEFEVTEILQPLESAPTPPSRNEIDYVSIYSDTYTNVDNPDYFPDWGQGGQGSSWAEFDLNGDKMLQYINLSYQGIEFGEEIDLTAMEYLHLDVWTTDVTDLEISLIRPGPDEKPVTKALTADQWTSIDIDLAEYADQGLSLADISI